MDRHDRRGRTVWAALLVVASAILVDARSPNVRASAASNQPPTVVFTAPVNGNRYDAPANVVLQASASDDVGVTRVDFYADGTLVGSDTSGPYELLWSHVPAGIHQVVAVATDTDGVQSSSTPVNLGVKPLPAPFNFARNQQTVASSSVDAAHGSANATDGNGSTAWTSAAGDGQWVYVDLGANLAVDHVTVKWGAAYATRYSIQFSTNPSSGSWSALYTNDAGDGGVDDFVSSGIAYVQYLRVLCTATGASNGCAVNELEVYRDKDLTPQPATPTVIDPTDGSEGNRTDPSLDWSSSYAQYVDLYFGTTNPPALFAGNLTGSASYRMWSLSTNTTYFWQIVARNETGSTAGPVWSFKTGSVANPGPPGTPANPSPADGASGVSTSATLTWTSTTATGYDVWLGTDNPPSQILVHQTAASVAPALIYNTTYFWRVVGHNVSGDTTGPIWSFTTVAPPAVSGTPIVWTNALTQENVVWMMKNGGVSVAATTAPMQSARWYPRAFIDLDGDRQPDLVWRDELNGQNVAWLMNESTLVSSAALPTIADMNWDIRGSGDFDGDGHGDLIWGNKATGQNLIWLMNGATLRSATMMPTISDLNWEIKGVGDLDGNGRADVIWRNKVTGQNLAWLMDGTTIVTAAFLPTIATNWDLKAVADLDGDGRADLVWRDTTSGRNVAWEMRGAAVFAAAFLPTVADVWWDIVTTIDDDGQADLVWRQFTTGQTLVWRMDGFAVVNSAFLPPMNSNWMVAPRR